jgi:uncharacterized membrane protein
MKNKIALKRHILKTITYRLLGTTVTFTSAYIIGGSLELASLLGVGELVFKPLLYFVHERFWFKFVKM